MNESNNYEEGEDYKVTFINVEGGAGHDVKINLDSDNNRYNSDAFPLPTDYEGLLHVHGVGGNHVIVFRIFIENREQKSERVAFNDEGQQIGQAFLDLTTPGECKIKTLPKWDSSEELTVRVQPDPQFVLLNEIGVPHRLHGPKGFTGRLSLQSPDGFYRADFLIGSDANSQFELQGGYIKKLGHFNLPDVSISYESSQLWEITKLPQNLPYKHLQVHRTGIFWPSKIFSTDDGGIIL